MNKFTSLKQAIDKIEDIAACCLDTTGTGGPQQHQKSVDDSDDFWEAVDFIKSYADKFPTK